MAPSKVVVLMAFMAAALSSVSMAAGLQHGFYYSSCPQAEDTVRNVVQGMINNDPTMGAAFVRLFFHDCFVRGCDASILLDPTTSNPQTEKTTIPLRGYDAVNKIKAAVEAVCSRVVSCADILAFAARDSIVASGGFNFHMPSGRLDGFRSIADEVFQGIPSPAFQLQELLDNFATKGLNAEDLVVLSGAHSFGLTHCNFVTPRLYPTVDPTMNATFAAALKKVLFTSDQTLMDQTPTTGNKTAAMVTDNAANPIAWMARFAGAMVKMGGIEVLTRTDPGEVRKLPEDRSTFLAILHILPRTNRLGRHRSKVATESGELWRAKQLKKYRRTNGLCFSWVKNLHQVMYVLSKDKTRCKHMQLDCKLRRVGHTFTYPMKVTDIRHGSVGAMMCFEMPLTINVDPIPVLGQAHQVARGVIFKANCFARTLC
uniref:Peroxidase n=1 Tax=Aegilops tauschii TaxID=37682 RepID=M8C4B4_AEGTA